PRFRWSLPVTVLAEPLWMRHRLFGAWPTKAVLLAGLLALALGLITLFVVRANRGPAVHVVTSAVTEGAITRTVMTTGILAPAKTVDVGAQVSGTVEFLGADFNSRVRAGDVLARLDP